jgi:hypothetical protein
MVVQSRAEASRSFWFTMTTLDKNAPGRVEGMST